MRSSINLVNQSASILYIDSLNTLTALNNRFMIFDYISNLAFSQYLEICICHLSLISNLSSISKLRSCITRTHNLFDILFFCRVLLFIEMIAFDIIVFDFISYFMLHR